MGTILPCRITTLAVITASALLPLGYGFAAEPDPAGIEFFEKKVRPVLAAKCYACHNSKSAVALGGLRLDTRAGLLKGGDSGAAIEPGNPEQSRLIRAISYQHELRMPPSGKLPDEAIADLTAWVRMGAPDPRTDAPPAAAAAPKGIDLEAGRRFWAFQPVRPHAAPKNRAGASAIDAFIQEKLAEKGLEPAARADKRTLIRRVTLDLTGLPPTPEEVDAFLKDNSAGAFSRVVDRLLASPRYGERWARHWLDLVRYAETNGHEYDNDKQDPWQYRDYVIRAFNEDVPYDQFVREHIAGDLLPAKRLRKDGATWESPVGTTQFWFGEVLNSATDSEKSRADEVDNQIDVMSKAFQGLTVACARCHDHKFDPLPTADYYSLAGFFHSTDMREGVIDSPARTEKIQALSKRIREINAELSGAPVARANVMVEKVPPVNEWNVQGAAFGAGPLTSAFDSRAAGSNVFVGTVTSPKFRTGKERYLHVRIAGTKSERSLNERGLLRLTSICDGYKGQHIVPDGSDTPVWKTIGLVFERERSCQLEIVDRSRDGYIYVDRIAYSDSKEPPSDVAAPQPTPPPVTAAVKLSAERRDALLAEKARLEAEVPPSEFAMIAQDDHCRNIQIHIRGNHKNLGAEAPRRFLRVVAGEEQPLPASGSSGRLLLAERMASRDNPLTARVLVNRVWAHLFGSGIVKSTDNFGKMGDPPSHPELLDSLAYSFMDSGWSVKTLIREIVLSNTYQQSGAASGKAAQVDPENRLLSHAPVRRLEGEAIRDAMLSLSGSLNPQMFGPSIVPHISKYQNGRGKPASGPLDGNGRRSIYIQVRRNFLTPMFLVFDYPPPMSAIGSRTVSTVPSQALMLMNNEFVAQQAGKWAAKAISAAPAPQERIATMYQAAFSRPPEARETEKILAFVRSQPASRKEAEVWADVAHVLFNSAEFIYVP